MQRHQRCRCYRLIVAASVACLKQQARFPIRNITTAYIHCPQIALQIASVNLRNRGAGQTVGTTDGDGR